MPRWIAQLEFEGVTPIGGWVRRPLSGVHLAAIETLLTEQIGPIAKVVIKRHAASSTSIRTLCDNLAQHIESEAKQKRFIEQAAQLLEE